MPMKMSSAEREAYYRLIGAVSEISRLSIGQDFAKRMRLIKNGARDLAMIKAVGEKLMRKILETMPDEQVKSVSRDVRNLRVYTKIKRVSEAEFDHSDGRWMSLAHLDLLYKATSEKCITCSGMGEAYYKCKLRKALDALPTGRADTDEERCGKCPYALMV